MKLVRRVSETPPIFSSRGGDRCPDIWETDSGDFVVIGDDVTDVVKAALPQDVDISAPEKAVLIPSSVLKSALKRVAE